MSRRDGGRRCSAAPVASRAARRARAARSLACGAFLAAAVASAGCDGGAGKSQGVKRAAAVFPVEIVPVATRRVEYSVSAVGSVEAFEVVQVTARVPGAVEKVHFAEGDIVRKGDLLVEIEPDRYAIEVQAARAALEKAEAARAEAGAGLARREGAVERNPGLIPGEELETWRTRVRTAAADATEKRAALERAEMNARDALARAPFGGAIQTRGVQTGQYVQPGALLTTLVRRDPLLLRFRVPEQDAARISLGATARFSVRNVAQTYNARITYIAESADEVSRMVAVTAEIDDPRKEELRPGVFAEVVVPVGASDAAAVVPQSCVRPSERGFLAYVISGGVAVERVLSLGMRTADGQVEVRAGLAPGESLVVRGAEALREGAAVRVVAPAEAAPAAAAPSPGPSQGAAP